MSPGAMEAEGTHMQDARYVRERQESLPRCIGHAEADAVGNMTNPALKSPGATESLPRLIG